MEAVILDSNFEELIIIDAFMSIIWTRRYNEWGDFEIVTKFSKELFENAKNGTYVGVTEDENLMFLEEISIDEDAEDGATLTLKGRSLESMLERRIVWKQTTLDGKLQGQIKKLLDQNIINPEIKERKIDGFYFKETDDKDILDLSISAQYTGDVIYDVLVEICQTYDIGFRFTYDEKITEPFIFELYKGVDHSDLEGEDWVILSSDFDSVINGNYILSSEYYKNVTLVAGEGEGSERRTLVIGEASGLERRELYTDARDIQSEKEDGSTIPDDEYYSLLAQRGIEKLSEYPFNEAFEGQVESSSTFVYGIDYELGDLVFINDDYGNESIVRVTEIIYSQDASGYNKYPTFKTIE